ncbi:hypothetical protein BPAE_0122g00100 [Botrytis paeoniae]|uniref:Uncharacterized protein n=1 Tax=Botrytis paeoniae TaxID=278948 RepID=A0A4Z1FFV9_9HELO|nr:hypothetical protein BPAE_0122g00100 [Botrytis paeoniae]
MALKAGVKKSKSKKIDTKNKNKRIKELCAVIFGDFEPKSQLHKPNSKFPFINCDPEDIKHLSEDQKECYRLISDYKVSANPKSTSQTISNWKRSILSRDCHVERNGGNCCGAAAEGITVQKFTTRAVVVQLHSTAAQCKTMAVDILAAEAQFRALASRSELICNLAFNDIDKGSSNRNRDMTNHYW